MRASATYRFAIVQFSRLKKICKKTDPPKRVGRPLYMDFKNSPPGPCEGFLLKTTCLTKPVTDVS